MVTIKQITIEYGYTFNLGNYSSVRPVVTLTADLAEGDEPDLVVLDLQEQARLAVEDEIDAALTLQGKPPYFKSLRNGDRLSDESAF